MLNGENENVQNAEALTRLFSDKLSLLRALANFHIEPGVADPEQNLANQRRQLVKCAKALEEDFGKLAAAWQLTTGATQTTTGGGKDLSTQDVLKHFIKAAVPPDAQNTWHDAFTGSLLVVFKNGGVDTSVLVEKQVLENAGAEENLEFEAAPEVSDLAAENTPEPASFTILPSYGDATFNFYYFLPEPANVVIRIYSDENKLVHRIEKQYDHPGDYTTIWDGLDNRGEPLKSAVYECQLQIGEALSERKKIDFTRTKSLQRKTPRRIQPQSESTT